jgi:REP element-mobilizing transposase RayT
MAPLVQGSPCAGCAQNIGEIKIDDDAARCYRQVVAGRQHDDPQLRLPIRTKPKKKFRHGGKRPGAGRKPKNGRAGAAHKTRPILKARFPVLVTLRVHKDVRTLRKRLMYRALREATIALAKRELHDREGDAFRIVHISIQRDHIHMLVEADHKDALSNGMQRFQISAAKHINAAVSIKRTERRRGSVFPDRFHQQILETPRQTRHALSYVLNNWRKHREDRLDVARTWNVDPYSTGALFAGWKERDEAVVWWRLRETYSPLVVYLPKTWLLREGWMKHGKISWTEVPGQRRTGSAK